MIKEVKQMELLEFLQENQGASSSEIEKFLGFKQTKTYHLLTALCGQGIIVKEGKGKNTRYYAVE